MTDSVFFVKQTGDDTAAAAANELKVNKVNQRLERESSVSNPREELRIPFEEKQKQLLISIFPHTLKRTRK